MAWLPLLALAVLSSGCAVSLSGPIPKTAGRAAVYHLVATPLRIAPAVQTAAVSPPATTVIDIPALYRTLLRTPGQISALDRDVFWCSVFIVLIGALNALLLAALPKTIARGLERDVVRRVEASVEAILDSTKTHVLAAAAANEPIAFATRLEATRMCCCGAAISARTRTGLCRRCAQIRRVSLQQLEDAPRPRALATSDDADGAWMPIATRTVARSRIGECRQYFTIAIAPLESEPATALN